MKDYEKKKLEKIYDKCADINILLRDNKNVKIDGLTVGTDISLFALDFLAEHIKVSGGKASKKRSTKVEHVKVDWKSFCDEKFSNLCDYIVKIDGTDSSAGVLSLEIIDKNKDSIYRKVERPIEWWENACDYASKIGHSQPIEATVSLDNSREYLLHVNAMMTKWQWCEFARIILGEDGE